MGRVWGRIALPGRYRSHSEARETNLPVAIVSHKTKTPYGGRHTICIKQRMIG